MENNFVHDRENSNDTEQHLSENRDKFQTDGEFLLHLMKGGRRLTRLSVVQDYGIDGRRLGELHSANQCEKSWKTNEQGKRLYVEYYCPIPLSPTKRDAILWATNLLDKMKDGVKQGDDTLSNTTKLNNPLFDF